MVFFPSDASSADARASIITDLQGVGSTLLTALGETVPADRIAVMLL